MSPLMFVRPLLLSLMAIILTAAPGWTQVDPAAGGATAATRAAATHSSPAHSSPIEIESDRMETGARDNSVIFSGGVVARQGDLVVHSDLMTIFYLSDTEKAQLPAGSERRLKKLQADGNVKIEGPQWTGSGERMEFMEEERKVYLSGNARVWQDDNLVTGDAVTMYLDEGRSIVEKGTDSQERVRAFFYSGGESNPAGPSPGPATEPANQAPATTPESR